MAELTFDVILTPDDEAGGFIAEVPTLPGCMTQGETESEALENIKDAILGCLEVRAEHGMYPFDPTPPRVTRQVQVNVHASIAARASGTLGRSRV
ncbi:MAG: type II toxin-antitoxin system HicB family antitoxin [Candidatus Poribacteria bacterium]|nr:type II toxin-antitoxin system HicB family antitoxin [Candidatus Poribacteria bacterium]